MKNQPLETAGGRVIFVRSPRRLSQEQLALALGSMHDDDPRWIAVNQILDEELAAAVLDSSSPDLTDAKVRHAGGRVDALSTLKQRLVDERKKTAAPAASTARRKSKQ